MTLEQAIERICVLEAKVAVLEAKLAGICFDPITPVAFEPAFYPYQPIEISPHTSVVKVKS